jgi:hypothetical protein
VAVLQPVSLTMTGSVGYYCGGLIDGPRIEVQGSCGWGLAESMLSGTVKSSIGLGMLLWSGIGDTIRVSLSADPIEEVRVGYEPGGAVTDVIQGAQDRLVVALRTGSRAEIPFVDALVPEVDQAGGWLRIDPPDGLLPR